MDVSGNFIGTAEKFQQSLTTLPTFIRLYYFDYLYGVGDFIWEFYSSFNYFNRSAFCYFGALLCLYILNQELNIFSFIGLIMLVGITKKNGIIMVDFALDAMRKQGLDAKQAILQACSIRFRPLFQRL